MSSGKTVVVIAGPTAVGKTNVAIDLAKLLNTEIISADSRQCFKEMNIGVARPDQEQLAAIPHHFIASHSIHEQVNAAVFEQYALDKAAAIFQNHDVLVMVGGTGLYIKAFCEGLDEIPSVPSHIRQDIVAAYDLHGMSWLREQVKQLDPDYHQHGEIQNPQRMMRALEVIKGTGRSILSYRRGAAYSRDFRIIKIALQKPREELRERINRRVDNMVERGLLEEVKELRSFQHLNALQTVGYRESFEYINGLVSLEDAVAAIKTHTSQYAKRQFTWFRKNRAYTWFDADDLEKIKEHLKDALAK